MYEIKVDMAFMTYKIPIAGMAAWIQHILRYWAPAGCYERFLAIAVRVCIAHVLFSDVHIFAVAQLIMECATEKTVTWPARFAAAEECLYSMFITERLPLPLLNSKEDNQPDVWWFESVQSRAWSDLFPAVFHDTKRVTSTILQMRKQQRHVLYVKNLMQRWSLPYPIPRSFLAYRIYVGTEETDVKGEQLFMNETALKYEHCLRADFFLHLHTDYFARYDWSKQKQDGEEEYDPYHCIHERLQAGCFVLCFFIHSTKRIIIVETHIV